MSETNRRADWRKNHQLVIAAARTVISEDGADASLERIARLAGVGSATLHRNFATRKDLLEAVFHDDVVRLCQHRAQSASSEPADKALCSWLADVAEHTANTRGLAMALLAEPGSALPEEDTCHGLIGSVTASLVDRARKANMLAPDVDADDLMTLANALALVTEGFPATTRDLLAKSLRGIVGEGLYPPRSGR